MRYRATCLEHSSVSLQSHPMATVNRNRHDFLQLREAVIRRPNVDSAVSPQYQILARARCESRDVGQPARYIALSPEIAAPGEELAVVSHRKGVATFIVPSSRNGNDIAEPGGHLRFSTVIQAPNHDAPVGLQRHAMIPAGGNG